MKKLELKKGLSYSTRDLSCKKGKPVMVSDEQAEKLLATGRFATVGDAVDEVPSASTSENGAWDPPVNANDEGGQQSDPQAVAAEPLSADKIRCMKKDALIALATENGIDISKCNNNDERAEKICGVLGLSSTVQLGLE